MLPAGRQQACVFSPAPTPLLPSHTFSAPGGKGVGRQTSATPHDSSLGYLPFPFASDSIFCLCSSSGFPTQPHQEPDKFLQSPSWVRGSEQQPATSRVSCCFAGRLLKKKKPSQIACTFSTFGKWFSFSGPRVRNLSDKN